MAPFPPKPVPHHARRALLALVSSVAALVAACSHATFGNGGGDGGSGGGGAATGAGGAGATGGAGHTDGGAGGAHDAAVETGPPRGPTPGTAGHNFPFPQNRESTRCIYPTGYLNDDVQKAYAQWKADTLTSSGANGHLRVQRPKDNGLDPNSTVSEGIGYGMLLAVYMDDQATFDQLWLYEQTMTYQDVNGLMNWYISADGQTVLGKWGATDADEDMAFALLMADKQWGGQGSLSKTYLAYATAQITAIWNFEIIENKLAGGGDSPMYWSWHNVNISYFAPAYYKAFKAANIPAGANWDPIVDTVYDTINKALTSNSQQQTDGLVPGWCDDTPSSVCTPESGPSSTTGANYQYDACRTPFRIALDWCWNGETRAQAYLAKTSSFFSNVGATKIVDGYGLDGTPQPQFAGDGGQSAAFVGPAAVGAMSAATYQTFLDQAYAAVATRQLLVGGTYYDDSWTALSLLMMTGNFINYANP
jgi:endo-1,4-beta-D-glucanase Y